MLNIDISLTQEDLLPTVIHSVEQLSKSVMEYMQHNMYEILSFRESLYALTFSHIMRTAKIPQPPPLQQLIISLHDTLHEFKRDLFNQVMLNPQMSLFDFIVSQQFNDLYDVLTASQRQLQGMDEYHTQQPTTPRNQQRHQEVYLDGNQLRVRSASMDNSSDIPIKYNDLEYGMLKQFQQCCYDQLLEDEPVMRLDSPKTKQKNKKNQDMPQLFSFDSSFLKDMPLQKSQLVSKFDETTNVSMFNFTLHNQSTTDLPVESTAQPTSRFESKAISEECDNSCDLSDLSIRKLNNSTLIVSNLNYKIKQLADKEKTIAQRELKSIIQEKQLNQVLGHSNSQILQAVQEQQSIILQQQTHIAKLTQEKENLLRRENRNNTNVIENGFRKKQIGIVKGSLYTLAEQMKQQQTNQYQCK